MLLKMRNVKKLMAVVLLHQQKNIPCVANARLFNGRRLSQSLDITVSCGQICARDTTFLSFISS